MMIRIDLKGLEYPLYLLVQDIVRIRTADLELGLETCSTISWSSSYSNKEELIAAADKLTEQINSKLKPEI